MNQLKWLAIFVWGVAFLAGLLVLAWRTSFPEMSAPARAKITTPTTPINKPIVWAQVHPDAPNEQNLLIARAIVGADARCPQASFDAPAPWRGKSWPLAERFAAVDGDFRIKVCEIAYPGHLVAKIGAARLPARPFDPQRIVVFGDTGCRVASWGTQNCKSEGEWPFARIAANAAALKPDLVIHLGDYHYREAPCPDAKKCGTTEPGDNFATWKEEFFDPAAPLLATAPWVMLRGNHEDWTRAGSGWRLLLSPRSREAREAPWPDESAPYVVEFRDLTLAVLDVANEGYTADAAEPVRRADKYDRWMRELSARPAPAAPAHQTWFFSHSPPWVSFVCKTDPCREQTEDKPRNAAMNAVRARLRGTDAPRFDLLFGGDTHMFQFFVPEKKQMPPQIVAGMGGALLEPAENYDKTVLDKIVAAQLFDVAGRLWMHYGFGFLVLLKQDGGWSGVLHDADGAELLRCDLTRAAFDRAQTEFPCKATQK